MLPLAELLSSSSESGGGGGANKSLSLDEEYRGHCIFVSSQVLEGALLALNPHSQHGPKKSFQATTSCCVLKNESIRGATMLLFSYRRFLKSGKVVSWAKCSSPPSSKIPAWNRGIVFTILFYNFINLKDNVFKSSLIPHWSKRSKHSFLLSPIQNLETAKIWF